MMKHAFGVTLLTLSVCWATEATAQQVPQLPLDPAVRYGTLDNGLTYYIRHNELPKDRAEFYIVQKVGSVLEEENQRGLAHFLEHMAFNGTKNFPGKAMLNYLEANSVKFGTNVNAYTSIDETVYNISDVPSSRWGLVDSCLLILHDWSGFITLDDKEIDDERGVIHEEWRTRSNSFLRMYENTVLPALYPNNRYGERMPIGTMEVVDNFPYQDLRDYYHKWYRPDLQGIIVVGDVNVDSVETRIKELWADIPAQPNAAERVFYTVEDNAEPIVAIASDKEASQNVLNIMYKHDNLPDELVNTQPGIYVDLLNSLIRSMLGNRFRELTQKADAPFLAAYGGDGNYMLSKTKGAFGLLMLYKEGEWQQGLNALMGVVNSASEYGFTPQELERAKAELKSSYENAWNERDKVRNSSYVTEYVKHFLENEPAPGIELEYQLVGSLLDRITLDQVNEALRGYVGKGDKNLVLLMMGIDKEGVTFPTEAELLAAYKSAAAAPATAYEETLSDEPLIAKMPKPGKVKKQYAGDLGTTVWELSNGAKVIFKPTDFKKDQILFTATSPGGKSLVADSDLANYRLLTQVMNIGGLGNFSQTDLNKVLAGKRARAGASIGNISESITGDCAPRDLETMLQLVYLNFTAPRKDEEAYAAYLKQARTALENAGNDPSTVFSDSITAVLYGHNPRAARLALADLDAADYDRILALRKERFANAGDFTFVFVGNIEPDSVRPLIEQYIASLPAKGKKEQYKEVAPGMVTGKTECRFNLPMNTPKVSVFNVLSGMTDYTQYNQLRMQVLSQIMTMVYTETIREEEGGTYGVSTYGVIDISPRGNYGFIYQFDTGEEKLARLETRAYDELARVAQKGPKQEMFDKVMGYLRKKHEQDVRENTYWRFVVDQNYRLGTDDHTNYYSTLESITPESIKELATEIINSGNRTEVICVGVAK
jgi:zinc protease